MFPNRIARHGTADPRKLLAHPQNHRLHGDDQARAVNAAMRQLGWLDEVIVSKNSGLILNGHLRVRQAVERGDKSVPVRYVDADAKLERLILASFDGVGAMAAIDAHRLDDLFNLIGGVGDADLQGFLDDQADATSALLEEMEAAQKRADDRKAKREAGRPQASPQTPQATQGGPESVVQVGAYRTLVANAAYRAWRATLGTPDEAADTVRKRLGF